MRTNLLYPLALAPFLLSACDGNNNNDKKDDAAPVACSGTAATPDRLFLQQLGSNRVIIKWRGSAQGGAEATAVCYGTDMDFLPENSLTQATVTATGHSEALIEGLQPDTTYYYSVGGAGSSDAKHSFRTAPAAGQLPADGNVRIWIVGDSGTNEAGIGHENDAVAVRDGYLNWAAANGGEPTDLFLMLGDNAYLEGTDAQYQAAVFEVYPDILSTAAIWPTIGNHEMGSYGVSTSADPDSYTSLGGGAPDPAPDSPMPYLNIFTLPTDGENGGVASGTEQYYSFDYGNVHVVSLDSQLAARDAASRAAMLEWLKDDLMANTNDWTVVMFHHPPYTKGSHDSDSTVGGIDQPIFDMRGEFTPVFEAYGVDLVYSGHSHIYERSKYIMNHTGLSYTFEPATMAELNDLGEPASGQGDEAYGQVTRDGMDDKVVYTVAGSSGQATATSPGYPHPAHYYSALTIGSVVVDATADTLTASFINGEGQVDDYFTVTR